jgi:penicillin-binding protein 1A
MIELIKRILIFLAVVAAFAGVLAGGVMMYLIHYYSQDLPDHKQLENYAPPIISRFYSKDGKLVEEYGREHRLYVPISDIPQSVIQAFVAAEDQNFYHHPGVDFMSVLRAIVQNVAHIGQGKSLVGGSTITQQVVKNFLLTNERSLARKVKEAILSFRITNIYTKDKILELYLNQIYLGAGAYGVAASSLAYFSKPMDALTIEEVALLAAMPKAPSSYDPRYNYNRAKERRDWVLNRMAEEGFITEEAARKASILPIALKKRDRQEVVKADFFAESVRQDIVARLGDKALYEGGLSVRTTLDPKLQMMADAAFRRGILKFDQRKGYRGPIDHLKTLENWQDQLVQVIKPLSLGEWELGVVLALQPDQATIGLEGGKKAVLHRTDMLWTKTQLDSVKSLFKLGDVVAVEEIKEQAKGKTQTKYVLRQIPAINGGMVVMEPRTGRVLALVGGYYFGDSQFNRATQAKRQTGSTFKTFVYMAALESGLPPNTIIDDGPIAISPGPGLPLWKPKNFKGDFLGPITMRKGLEQSRNLVTIRLGQMVGIKKIGEVVKRFGISDNPPTNPAMVLGASEATLLSMTHAYSMIANGGIRTTPSLIERIQNYQGKEILKRDTRRCDHCQFHQGNALDEHMTPTIHAAPYDEVTDARSAYQMVSMLEGVVLRGTGRRALSVQKTLAGKTGTTNGPNNSTLDTWFIGFSPDLAVGVYVGYDTLKNLGKSESGATVSLPIFVDFMEQALKDVPDKPFRIPPGIAMIPVNAANGEIANDDTPKGQLIYEAFKTGTEPESVEKTPAEESQPIPEGAGGMRSTPVPMIAPAADNAPPPHAAPAEPAPLGTGGIY